MNPTIRFNELFHNFNPDLTSITQNTFNTNEHTVYITQILHNIYSNCETYTRIILRNKIDEQCEAYYLDDKTDHNILLMIIAKLNEIKNNEPVNNKRKAEDPIDTDYQFKKMRLDDNNNNDDDVINTVRSILKYKRVKAEDPYNLIHQSKKTKLIDEIVNETCCSLKRMRIDDEQNQGNKKPKR